nr:S-layer homology domain-containing protein [Paenibacillus camelliae]
MLVIARNGGNRYYATANDSSAQNSSSFKDISVGSEYFAYVEDALQQNLIDIGDGSFNPEGTVTREEMAELIVRALGYNTLAQHEHIFADKFNDSQHIKNKGQAAIVVGLNIMSANADGKFQPSKKVQRAEAATAFFRYLQSRADLQEAPLRY